MVVTGEGLTDLIDLRTKHEQNVGASKFEDYLSKNCRFVYMHLQPADPYDSYFRIIFYVFFLFVNKLN